jgi:hypothetical protein
MAQVSEFLINDHTVLDKVLKQLQSALRSSDLAVAHGKLDLFWARLAVHIRAEHLHLFPAVLTSLENAEANHAFTPSLEEAKTVTAELRRDHDFFIHELARAIQIMHQLLTTSQQTSFAEGLDDVKNTVLQVEQRLVKHNAVEESQIYRWSTTLFNSEEQAKLAKQITIELGKHPPRFTVTTWLEE